MIQVGDQVASRDEVTSETTWKPVVRLFRNTNKTILKVMLENEAGQQETLGTTSERPFYIVDKGWTEAGQLKAGDPIVSLEIGQVRRVHSVVQAAERQDTYNFQVTDYHTYFVGHSGTWVHNVCWRRLDELIPIHSSSTVGIRSDLVKLSDDELMKAVTAPLDGQMVTVNSKTGGLMDGNSRVLELQRKMSQPSSSINSCTKIPVETYRPNDFMFWG